MDNSAIQTLEAAAQILMVSVSVNNNLLLLCLYMNEVAHGLYLLNVIFIGTA